MDLPDSLHHLATVQDGLVTRRQALEHGLSRDAIRHALGRSGRWQRVAKGVYATFTGRLEERHLVRAALLHAGPDAVVTGSVACRAYGMRYAPVTGTVQVLVPAHVQRSAIPFATIRRTRQLPRSRNVRGFPCAPPERSALDACLGVDDLRVVRAALCEVVQRGLTTSERLAATHRMVGRSRSGLPGRALADVLAGCRSAPECELRDVIRSSAVLAEPRWNQPLPDPHGADLVPDACWPEARLVVEVDSVEWHRFGDAPEATERRRARYAKLGWRVLPVSPRRLREEPEAVLAEIEAAVAQQMARAA